VKKENQKRSKQKSLITMKGCFDKSDITVRQIDGRWEKLVNMGVSSGSVSFSNRFTLKGY
jgi:hypothetical protein